MSLKLIITGCGHSGTRYLANVLRNAGIKTAHESQYSAVNKTPVSADVEVSWLAAGFELPEGVTVWQVVRDPLRVANSFKRENFFGKSTPYSDFVRQHMTLDADNPELSYWLEWNRLAEAKASVTFCLEALDVAAFVRRVSNVVDKEVTKEAAEFAAQTQRVGMTKAAQVLTLGNDPLSREVSTLASKYGYIGYQAFKRPSPKAKRKAKKSTKREAITDGN